MASMTLTALVGTTLTPSVGKTAEALAQTATVKADVAAIVYTTVAANIATLVADGASPTQGHVNTLDTNWAALKALIDTAVADAAALPGTGGDVVLQVNAGNVVTKNKLDEILRFMRQQIEGSNLLT